MFSRTFSATHLGLAGSTVEIETVRQEGLPKIVVTGLAGDVVRESRERICACLQNLGFDCPSGRLVVHLSPAQTKKQGSQLDLAIAVGLLKAEGAITERTDRFAFLGEIALDGKVRKIPRALPLIEALISNPSIEKIYVPQENAFEAAISGGDRLRLVHSLSDVLGDISGRNRLPTVESQEVPRRSRDCSGIDRIQGQIRAKRAIQIAVAGRHHLLMSGPPGVGKSSLADCVVPLFPTLTSEEARDILRIHDGFEDNAEVSRPFRAPHHSISGSALLGGGTGCIVAGEVTLAHHGVLFLDELPQFRSDLLESLREPMQTESIRLHRVGHGMTMPASFLLIAAMNPCPCGMWGDTKTRCRCAPDQVVRYQQRISGPILERIDLFAFLERESIPPETPPNMRSEQILSGIYRAREMQYHRIKCGVQRSLNGSAEISEGWSPPFDLDRADTEWFESQTLRDQLSLRASHKWLRIARTIADIAGEERIRKCHLVEAQELRCRRWSRLGYGYTMK